ncbi:MAG: exosome complex protein Rrp42 [Candidatus Caldarchaeum sp.]|uniref:Exosome complex component Rrp42 n=1 Tax=Caldiarchaeum subterraneum TaxID=311458 RepID=A0A7C5L783_CALS0
MSLGMEKRGYAIKIMKNKVYDLLKIGKRIDERSLDQLREIKIVTRVVEKADGSALVSLGKTKILTGIKVEVGSPYPDRPNEGVFTVNAELLPLASKSFEPGPPDERAIELSRIVDRCIRESRAIDLEKLVLIEGQKVYMLYIDCYVLDYDGNYFDAAVLSAVAALMSGSLPVYRVIDGRVELAPNDRMKIPLRTPPVSVTMGLIGDKIVVDPLPTEEEIADTLVTIGIDSDNVVAAIQKSSPGLLPVSMLKEMIKLSLVKSQEIRAKLLEAVGNGR